MDEEEKTEEKKLQLLKEEHNFEFNKNGVPEKLKVLLIEIENNKRKWKSLYMAVWGLPLYFLTPSLIDKGKGDEVIPWGLPAAKLKAVLYTPNELKNYLTSYDKEIHISQVIKIFTLIENYFFKYYELTEKPRKEGLIDKVLEFIPLSSFIKKRLKPKDSLIDFTYFKLLKRYLKDKNFASDRELNELELAKETRNCFVHRRGLINKRWLKSYKKTGRQNRYKEKDEVPLNFHDLEDWSDIMVRIIESSIKSFK
jgi:hypothetical protein